MKSASHNNMARILAFAAACAIGSNCFAQSSSGETTAKDVKKELSDVSSVIQKYSADRKDEAVSTAKAALNELDASIAELESAIEAKSSQMSQATRRKASETMQGLRQQRNRVAEWYGGMKHSSRDAWVDVKKGFSESYSALVNSWDKARQEFEDGS